MLEVLETIFTGVPMILFMTVVAPVWIIFHYIFNKSSKRYLSKQEQLELDVLKEEADKMYERIEVLEKLLDVETPNWRKNDESS